MLADDAVLASVALGDDEIARLDAVARRRGITRNELLGVLIRSGLEVEERRLADAAPSGAS
jgi:ribosomal protein L20